MSGTNDFLKGINHLVDTGIKRAPFDKTYNGRVTKISGSTYTVNINGVVYEQTPTLTSERLYVGDIVKVVFPQNNSALRYILNVAQDTICTTLYDKDHGLSVAGEIAQGHIQGVGLAKTGASGTIANNEWNIVGMNLAPYRRLRIVVVRGQVATFEIILPLENNIAVASGNSATFGDRRYINYAICAASKSTGNFAFCDSYSLYGTTDTTLTDVHVVKIEGLRI